jgi:ABC-type transporter Mla subunit MlaD
VTRKAVVAVGPVESAVGDLRRALRSEGPEAERLARLRAALEDVRRQERQLLARVSVLLGAVDAGDEGPRRIFAGAERLLVDLEHHVQRLHDLAYDEVELELGESG